MTLVCRRMLTFAAVAVTASAGVAIAAPGTAVSATKAARCREVSYPVHVLGRAAHLAGTLCATPGARVLEVLLPGGTYNRSYWNAPGAHSYVAAAHRAGFATLALDRLDTGKSTQTNPVLTTATVNAASIHQTITAVRDRYRIVLVGHSLGSLVAADEAATYHDVAGVILSGFSHALRPVFMAAVTVRFTAANLQSRFAGRPVGELTSVSAAARAAAFDDPDVPKAITDWDWRHRDTMDVGELSVGALQVYGAMTGKITAAVLNVVGADDRAFGCSILGARCSTTARLRHAEAPRYPNAASYTPLVVGGSGHDLNLANSANSWFHAANTWTRRSVEHARR